MQTQLKSLFTFGLSLALSVSVAGLAQADDEAIWDSQRQIEAYYTPTNGLSRQENAQLEKAYAALKENNFEQARQLLEPLSQSYPDQIEIQLKLAETYLGELNPDQAQELLQQTEAKVLPEDERTQEDTLIYFHIRMLLAKSWMIQNEPEKALRIFNESKYKRDHLTANERAELHLFKAKAYQSMGKWIETESELKSAQQFAPLSSDIDKMLQTLAPQIAESYYRKALAAFRNYDFSQALPLAQSARSLNPHSQAYLALYLESHERLQDETTRRFLKVRQPLSESLKKIRWALEVEDHAKAQNLYDQMLSNKDIAYLLQPVPRSLLPVFMQQTLNSLDSSLKQHKAS